MPEMRGDKKTIEKLEHAIRSWIEDAEENMRLAQESKKKALAFLKQFESVCADLTAKECPFCKGTMLNTSLLKPLAEQLDPEGFRLGLGYEPGRFCVECQDCDTYETDDPRDWAKRWARDDIKKGSKLFAAEVFKFFSDVDEVALENIGRLWMFRIGQKWHGSSLDKHQLKRFWKMQANPITSD